MTKSRVWQLHDHQSRTLRRDVREHYESATDELKAAFDAHWELMEVRPREMWKRPDAHKLRSEAKGGFREFFELRFVCERKQQRPLGFFGMGDEHFTLLLWAIEKGSKFDPPGAIATCEKRRDALLNGDAMSVLWNGEEDEEDESGKAEKASAQDVPRRIRQGAR